ncbi:MAG: low molecular weight phosphotyrosine protein phosphatase [Gammaproteobacteria bacterium]|nr:low molecular weight phosphotyrosine protein phosphatase [Gammaproteobacteria bacterium]
MKTRVLFVCMGNICRSPTAQGMFSHLLEKRGLIDLCDVDSAGTISYHAGSPPDRRAQAAARGRGIDLSGQRARQVMPVDFESFDFILAMDEDNLADLLSRAPTDYRDNISLIMQHAGWEGGREVPDPYYGGASGFEQVLDLLEAACNGFIDNVLLQRLSESGNG